MWSATAGFILSGKVNDASIQEENGKSISWGVGQYMDQVVDEIRGRFDYQSIQRAFMYQDKILAQLNAKEHTVHPQAYFHG